MLPVAEALLRTTGGAPGLRGTACVVADVKCCGGGSSLDPGGLGAGEEESTSRVFLGTVADLGRAGLLGAVMGMGSPVEVVLSLMIG